MAANEQEQILNQLFVDATRAYVAWLNNWLNTEIYRQAVELAKQRAEGVKLLYKNGDRPAIDTLEALILVQSREQKLIDYETKLMTSKNDLASYLWLENAIPIDSKLLNILPDAQVLSLNLPDGLSLREPSIIADLNPEVKNFGIRVKQLEVDRRLKFDQIKPSLNVNLGLLNSGRNIFNNMNAAWLQNNQKFGFTLSMPLTFTKQRASYSLAKLKLKDAEYTFLDKKNLTAIKWENFKNDLQNLDNQIKLVRRMEENSFSLLKGEEIKFSAGESSLFLVNSREQQLLEVREMANEISVKRINVIQNLRLIANFLEVN
jgi:outer membrane protein TolC